MPYVNLPDGARIFYRVDDFTDPWSQPETILMLHGFCRNSRFWYAWVPILGRHFRVVRPDLRGCGKSDVPAPGFAWSLAQYHDDLIAFMDIAKIERAHFVGESMGGMVMPYIYSNGQVINQEYAEEGINVKALVKIDKIDQLKEFILV